MSAPSFSSSSVPSDLVDVTLAFLEVALHTVLYARGVYPAAAFDRRQEFGVPVFACRHPEVCASLHALLYEPLQRRAVEAVSLFLDGGAAAAACEQYTFEIELATPGGAIRSEATSADDLDASFASALTQLLMHDITRPKVPRNVEWTVLVRARSLLEVDSAAAGAWARVESGDRTACFSASAATGSSAGVGAGADRPSSAVLSTSLKSIRVGQVSLQLSLDRATATSAPY